MLATHSGSLAGAGIRLRSASILCLLGLLCTACSSPFSKVSYSGPVHALPCEDTHKEGGVVISVVPTAEKHQYRVTLTPIPYRGEPIHFYDTAMPLTGVGGVGRPARVELTPERLDIVSPPTIEQSLVPSSDGYEGYGHYKPGPVSFVFKAKPSKRGFLLGGIANLHLTYMACGRSFCRPPVTRRLLRVAIKP